jgi:hypothetical protein
LSPSSANPTVTKVTKKSDIKYNLLTRD